MRAVRRSCHRHSDRGSWVHVSSLALYFFSVSSLLRHDNIFLTFLAGCKIAILPTPTCNSIVLSFYCAVPNVASLSPGEITAGHETLTSVRPVEGSTSTFPPAKTKEDWNRGKKVLWTSHITHPSIFYCTLLPPSQKSELMKSKTFLYKHRLVDASTEPPRFSLQISEVYNNICTI